SAEDPGGDAGGRSRPGVHDQVVGDDPCQLHLPAVAVVDEELLFHRVVEHPWAGLRDGSVVTYRVDAERGAVELGEEPAQYSEGTVGVIPVFGRVLDGLARMQGRPTGRLLAV